VKPANGTVAIAARLVRNGLRYRYLRLAGKPGKPQAASLEVTHACVARCVMCNIWKIPRSVPDMPLEDWTTLLSSDLLSDLRELDITGGEPFLRDDLVPLLRTVCELKRTRLKRLTSVAITTNGILTDRVVGMVGKMLEPMAQCGLELVVVCALDAASDLHDQIRRYAGAWSAVGETIAGLLELRKGHPNLIVGLKTTVMPLNVGELEAIADYARDHDLFTIISPAIATPGRYLNADKAGSLTLDAAQRARLAEFYKQAGVRWSHHAKALVGYLETGKMSKPCTCGFNYFFVRSSGDVFLCPLFEEPVGSLETSSIAQLFASKEGRNTRKRVGKAPECARCTEPGLERYSLPYEGFAYLRTLPAMGPRSFLSAHRHLGLDKYV
jgi:MoaA/NifB/PqqE/SkfB family radical SAM enzyme